MSDRIISKLDREFPGLAAMRAKLRSGELNTTREATGQRGSGVKSVRSPAAEKNVASAGKALQANETDESLPETDY